MPTDLTVELENRPGTLAAAGEALGRAGVNIDGVCGAQEGDVGVIHMLFEDGAAARSALEGAGATVRGEREVLVADIEDRPGALGEVARRLADAGVNIDLVYLAAGPRIVLGIDDMERAGGAL